jgi:hypothetical protein
MMARGRTIVEAFYGGAVSSATKVVDDQGAAQAR